MIIDPLTTWVLIGLLVIGVTLFFAGLAGLQDAIERRQQEETARRLQEARARYKLEQEDILRKLRVRTFHQDERRYNKRGG